MIQVAQTRFDQPKGIVRPSIQVLIHNVSPILRRSVLDMERKVRFVVEKVKVEIGWKFGTLLQIAMLRYGHCGVLGNIVGHEIAPCRDWNPAHRKAQCSSCCQSRLHRRFDSENMDGLVVINVSLLIDSYPIP